MINFEEDKNVIDIYFEFPKFNETIKLDTQERIANEILKIKGVYETSIYADMRFTCDFDKKEEIKTYIQTNIGQWINEEYQKEIDMLHEEYSVTGEGYLVDLIQALEKEKYERINR